MTAHPTTALAATPGAQTLRIVAVDSPALLEQFIALPFAIFAADPNWVAPLLLERRMHLSAKSNPFFLHARWQAWIAMRGTVAVGRISAQIDALHIERHQDATGYFGMLDAEDSHETFAALLATAEQWLRERGMQRVRGPFSLSINEETGLLIEGFDTPPVFMMGHAWPYYGARIEACGYAKAQDMFAYLAPPDFTAPAVMQRLVQRETRQVKVRPLDRSRFASEMALLRDIFNDAWSQNWGFVPFTAEEFDELGRNLRFLLPTDLIQIAEIDGEGVAFIIALPNLNEAIRGLNGRLLPLGWLKLLWRLKVRFPSTARVPLMGVRSRFQDKRIGAALAFLVIDTVRQGLISRGVKQVELSWILEDNTGMRSIIESIGGKAYKRYRVYERVLT